MGPADPLGTHGGMAIFHWYFSGSTEYRDPLFKTGAWRKPRLRFLWSTTLAGNLQVTFRTT
jgi:hypothetical protein